MRTLKILMSLLAVCILFAFVTPRFGSTTVASTQDAKIKPDGLMLECSVIDSLDDCVQARFSKSEKRFGITRMKPVTLHVNYFVPETQEEREVIKELGHDGWQVAFYLAGRRVLGPAPDLTKFRSITINQQHPIINGPLAITTNLYPRRKMTEESGLPKPGELWDHAQRAMTEFDTKNQYDFSSGRWRFIARPIRAQESCLKCHNNDVPAKDVSSPRKIDPPNDLGVYVDLARSKTPIKVGDALGVAIYAYARAKENK